MYVTVCVSLQTQSISERKRYCQKDFSLNKQSFEAKTMGIYYLFEKNFFKEKEPGSLAKAESVQWA